MRILIAEDDPVSNFVLKTTLTKWDYEVINTTNGREAWQALNGTDSPDLIILDRQMPGMGGLEICEKIRASETLRGNYVILLTQKNGTENVIQGLNAGADDYVTKPFEPQELLARIRVGERVLGLRADLEECRKREHYLAYYDSLTDLPNRQLFYDRLQHELTRGKRYDYRLSLLFLDLDGFKKVNDTLGHDIGDRLLQTVAQRLKRCLRESDTIARLGGDEFTVIYSPITQGQDASVAARKILDTMAEPIVLDGNILQISTSIGISTAPDDGQEMDMLIKHADEAMYHVKGQGKNNYHFYNPGLCIESL